MIADNTDRDPVEELAAEFLDRHRLGEKPTIEEYTRRHPELAEEIRDLFPTIAALEGWKVDCVMAPTRPVPPGEEVAEYLGDFHILREIGRGGMGIVYEAMQESLGRHVAIKVLPRGPQMGEKQLRRFHREAKTAARLHHTNIVPVYAVGVQDDLHYYVMQYIRGAGLNSVAAEIRRQLQRGEVKDPQPPAGGDGGDQTHQVFSARDAAFALRSDRFSRENKRIHSDPASSDAQTTPVQPHRPASVTQTQPPGPLPDDLPPVPSATVTTAIDPASFAPLGAHYWRGVARLGRQVADALQYAHSQGTLHRDIKPANLLLDGNGMVWVTDFGLARALEEARVTDTGDVVGTLLYMAPEQFDGETTTRSDIYSLGVTLCEMLTLQPIFQSSNKHQLIRNITQGEPRRPRTVNPHIPLDLETIVLKAMAREPEKRYANAAELRDDLDNFLDDRPIRARRITPLERLGRWCRRNKALAAVSGVAVLLLLLVAVTASVGYLFTQEALKGKEKALIGEEAQKDQAEKNWLQAKENLGKEAVQRKRAEKTSELAVEALEKIFDQLAPKTVVAASELTFEVQGDEGLEVPLQMPLSRDTAALLEQMLEFYDRLAEEGGSDDRLLLQKALASRRVGDIQFRLNQFDSAKKAYEQAAAIYQDFQTKAPQDLGRTVDLARVHNALGQVYRKQFRFPEAVQSYRDAIQILEAAAPDGAQPELIQYELAQTYFLLGTTGPRQGKFKGPGPPDDKGKGPVGGNQPGPNPPNPPGDKFGGPKSPWKGRDEGREYLQKAVALLENLVKSKANVPAYRHLLALCYREMPQEARFGLPQGENKNRTKSIGILRALVKQYPGVPDYRYDLVETLARFDGPPWHVPKNDNGSAQKALEEALDLSRELVSQYGNVPDYKVSKVLLHFRLALLQSTTRQTGKVEEHFRQALALQETMVRLDPKFVGHQVMKAELEAHLADFLRTQKKPKDALALLLPMLTRLEKLLADDPGLESLRFPLSFHYQRLAAAYHDLGQEKEAAAASRKSQDYRPSFKGGPRPSGG